MLNIEKTLENRLKMKENRLRHKPMPVSEMNRTSGRRRGRRRWNQRNGRSRKEDVSLMTVSRQFLPIFLVFVVCNANTEKTPSLNEIKNLRNSDLDEIFGSTMTKPPVNPDFPDMAPQGPSMGPVESIGRFNRGPSGPREVPINHGHALGPQVQPNNGEFQQLAAQGANVFATGANAFYRGAASVGEAFGIPAGNYQVPLFSQAASLFGK